MSDYSMGWRCGKCANYMHPYANQYGNPPLYPLCAGCAFGNVTADRNAVVATEAVTHCHHCGKPLKRES